MSYLGKLSPSIGGGLGGLPKRDAVVAGTTQPEAVKPKVEVYPDTFEYKDHKTILGTSTDSNTYGGCPVVIGNDIYYIYATTTTNDRVFYSHFEFDPVTETLSQPVTTERYQTVGSYSYYASLDWFTLSVGKYAFARTSSSQYIEKNPDKSLTFHSDVFADFLPQTGTFTYDSSPYTNYSNIRLMGNYGDGMFAITAPSGSESNQAFGLTIFDKELNILKSRGFNTQQGFAAAPMIGLKQTDYGCIVAFYSGGTTQYHLAITFDFDLNEIDRQLNATSYSSSYPWALAETLDGLGIGCVFDTTASIFTKQLAAFAVNPDGTFKPQTIDSSPPDYMGFSDQYFIEFNNSATDRRDRIGNIGGMGSGRNYLAHSSYSQADKSPTAFYIGISVDENSVMNPGQNLAHLSLKIHRSGAPHVASSDTTSDLVGLGNGYWVMGQYNVSSGKKMYVYKGVY